MIKFVSEGKDRKVIGFGLTERNLELLKEGKPILVDLAGLGVPSVQITIFYGKDEKTIYQDLKNHGFVSDETKLHVGKL
jgi:hypothetical protein